MPKRSTLRLADLAARYLQDHVAVRCKPKTVKTARSVVNRHIVPTLGKLSLASVKRKHVMECTSAYTRPP